MSATEKKTVDGSTYRHGFSVLLVAAALFASLIAAVAQRVPAAGSTTGSTQGPADTTPPTISASVSPALDASEWHGAAVTVTFSCADPESGVRTCTAPVTVSTPGVARVAGTSINGAGLSASTTATIRLDGTPPVVSVLSPVEGDLLPGGITRTTVRVAAHDVHSGVDALGVTCDGAPAVVAGAVFTCANVPVVAGANTVQVRATDRVGRSTTIASTFYVGTGAAAATSITVSPAKMVLVPTEARQLRVRDDRGRVTMAGTWSTSAPLVATVSTESGRPVVTALAVGSATLTVVSGGLTSSATVEVLPEGAAQSAAKELWSLASDGEAPPKRADVLRAVLNPAFPPEEQPGLFFVDEGTEWSGVELTRGPTNRPTRIRAVTLDGRELWEHRFIGRHARHIAGDQEGGVVIVREAGTDNARGASHAASLVKLDGLTGRVQWAAFAREELARFSEVTIHPSGTVYVLELGHDQASRLRAFNGATGEEQAWDLPSGSGPDGPVPASVAGPITREDGAVTLVTRTQSESGSSATVSVTLVTLMDGASEPTFAPVSLRAYTTPLSQLPKSLQDYRLLPDGFGGLLIAQQRRDEVLRLPPSAILALPVELAPMGGTATKYDAEYVLGDDQAYAFVQGRTTEGGTTTYWSRLVGFNPGDPAPGGPVTLVATGPQPSHLRLQFAQAGSGVALSGPSGLLTGVGATLRPK